MSRSQRSKLGKQTLRRILRRRHGFSLPESVVAVAIISLAGTSLLVALGSALRTGVEGVNQVLAEGIASQMMGEITRQRYMEVGQSWNHAPLGPESGETQRIQFDDVDDYNGLTVQPPADRWGQGIGLGDGAGGLRPVAFQHSPAKLADWRTRVVVEYVNETDFTLATATPTMFRRIRVFVEQVRDGNWYELARLQRVIGYTESPAS